HAEDEVPSARVEPTRVVAELVEDLVHLERRGKCLDQNGSLDRPLRDPELLLPAGEDVVPESRLAMALELRQIEVRSTAAIDAQLGVVEEIEPEIHERTGDRGAVHEEVLLDEVPASRPHHEGRERFVE